VLDVGAITAAEAVGYVASQIVGGVTAALLLRIGAGGCGYRPQHARARAWPRSRRRQGHDHVGDRLHGREVVLAFFLVTAVLGSAVAGRRPAHAGRDRPDLGLQHPYGRALTGMAFNPARRWAR
jgi:aquaporin Z